MTEQEVRDVCGALAGAVIQAAQDFIRISGDDITPAGYVITDHSARLVEFRPDMTLDDFVKQLVAAADGADGIVLVHQVRHNAKCSHIVSVMITKTSSGGATVHFHSKPSLKFWPPEKLSIPAEVAASMRRFLRGTSS
jgi:carbamoylphosphate synthase small subunit